MHEPEHDPLPRAGLERAIGAMRAGTPFKAAYEELLFELDDAAADRTMQLQREARGTWLLLLCAPFASAAPARALLVGNALSGTSVALALHGFEVTLLDSSMLRASFALLRNQALAPNRTRAVLCADTSRLPFADQAFDLVVREQVEHTRAIAADLAECRRVCRGELLLVADNRFAYKRSSGRRGRFETPGPLAYARRALAPSTGERGLAGYRRLLAAPDFAPPRAFALYPHAREFTFVVGLDHELPRLEVGPKERENTLKVVGHKLGLFPWLTPSFALIGARHRAAGGATRIERILRELGRLLGAPVPQVEHLVATRGNSAVVLTAHADPRSRWCLHIPLSPAQRGQLVKHFEILRTIVERFAGVPVPRPLFLGELDGVFLTCEQRMGGLTAPQLSGDADSAARMFADVARHTAALVTEPARVLDAREFEALVGARFDLVARFARVPSTLEHLARMRDEARAALVGRSFPRVVHHGDLRSKHVQVERDGRVLGLLDWGSGEHAGLPYFDLVHLIAHERKQARGVTATEAWRVVRERELEPHEQRALDDYAARLGLDDDFRRAIERMYPVLVAAMAESHWDYSRPRWVHRQFGV